jgi:hypothetical protein
VVIGFLLVYFAWIAIDSIANPGDDLAARSLEHRVIVLSLTTLVWAILGFALIYPMYRQKWWSYNLVAVVLFADGGASIVSGNPMIGILEVMLVMGALQTKWLLFPHHPLFGGPRRGPDGLYAFDAPATTIKQRESGATYFALVRWPLLPGVAFLSVALVGVLSQKASALILRYLPIEPDSLGVALYESVVLGFVLGAIFVYAGVRTAPSNKKTAALCLVSFVALLSLVKGVGLIRAEDWWSLIQNLSACVGAGGVAWAIWSGRLNGGKPVANRTESLELRIQKP